MADRDKEDMVSFVPRAKNNDSSESETTRGAPSQEDLLHAFDYASRTDQANLMQHMQDIHMIGVDQWPADVKQRRREDGKPTLESNILAPIVHRIVNDVLQNQPGMSYVSGRTEGEATRKINEASALLRGILSLQDSKAAIRQAVQNQVICGYGHWGLELQPNPALPSATRLRLRAIPTFDGVMWDPNSKGLVKEDANYCFVKREVSRQHFIAMFPKHNPDKEDMADNVSLYYRNISGLYDGQSNALDTPEGVERIEVSSLYDHYGEEATDRMTYIECFERRVVGWVGANDAVPGSLRSPVYGVFVTLFGKESKLHEYEWPGTIIPVFTCLGSLYPLPRRTIRNGVVANLADTQRTYNLLQSIMLEQIASQNLATWLVPADSIAPYDEWGDLGQQTGYLRYNPGEGDKPLPPPERIGGPAISEGLASVAALLVRNADMISGVSEAYKGERSNETSRAAIVARTSNSALAVDHYPEHLASTLRRFGEAVGELIPKVYNNEQPVLENVVLGNGQAPQHQAVGDLSDLEFIPLQVELTVNYATRKEQQVGIMQELLHNVPDLAAVMLPYFIKQLDLDDKDEIIEALRMQMQQAAERDPLQDQMTAAQIEESGARAAQHTAQAVASLMPPGDKGGDKGKG